MTEQARAYIKLGKRVVSELAAFADVLPGNYVAEAGIYEALFNRNMAISIDRHGDGSHFGIKPGEFHWCTADGLPLDQPTDPEVAAVWDGNQVRSDPSARLAIYREKNGVKS
jgi:hypothetical protein